MIKFIIPVLVVIALSVAAFFICGDKIGEIIYPTPAAPVAEEAPFTPDPAPAAPAPAAPAPAAAPAEGGGAQDILAMIRARQG